MSKVTRKARIKLGRRRDRYKQRHSNDPGYKEPGSQNPRKQA